jgi:hypothetical protein
MARLKVENMYSLRMTSLRRYGYLKPWAVGSILWGEEPEASVHIECSTTDPAFVRVRYSCDDQNGDYSQFDYKIRLEKTPCQFGGHRYWLLCPLMNKGVACARRVGVLYLAGDYFGCRQCYDLAYRKQFLSGTFMHLDHTCDYSDLDDELQQLPRKFYRGKPTRRVLRIMKKLDKWRGGISRLNGI